MGFTWARQGGTRCHMRKSFRILTGAILIIAPVLIWAWPYVTMQLSGNAHYKEQNKRQYEFYTPVLLKMMPRITPRYDFDFVNISGPAAHVYAIRFYDTDDVSKINDYLTIKGYQKQQNCHIKAVCWKGSDADETVTVSTLNNPKVILVSVIINF